MTLSAAQAERFYAEVLCHGEVWAIRDAGGYPAPENEDGRRVMPFWSLRTRADAVINSVDAYKGFIVEAIPLGIWRERWLRGLAKDRLLVGLNWSGTHATGWDVFAGRCRTEPRRTKRLRQHRASLRRDCSCTHMTTMSAKYV